MSLLTAPLRSVGRHVDDAVACLLPALAERVHARRHDHAPGRGPAAEAPGAGAAPPRVVRPAGDRAHRARREAAAYLAWRQDELRRDLEARR